MTFVFVVSGTTTGAPPGDYAAAGSLWDVIGGGGSGAVEAINANTATGGGGGAWSQIATVTWTSAQTCQIGAGGAAKNTSNTAGAAGTDTWVRIDGGATAPATTAQGALAKAGAGGLVSAGVTAGGAGGASGSGVGTTKNSGGNGGGSNDASNSGGAGGGAGGSGGVGGAGGADTASGATATGGTGGGANGGGGAGGGISTLTSTGATGGASITTANQTGHAGGAGGTANNNGTTGIAGAGGGGGGGSASASAAGNGGAGGPGTEYDSLHGSGGGGGCGGGNSSSGAAGNGGNGALYGGGGGATGGSTGGAAPTSGAGGAGILVITYTPATVTLVPVASAIRSRFFEKVGALSLRPGPPAAAFQIVLPFSQTDQSSSKVNPNWAPYPQTGLNPNLFTNPVPVLNQFTAVFDITNHYPVDQALNINLYTNPVPALNQFVPVKRPPWTWPGDQALNINLFTNPFPIQNQFVSTFDVANLRPVDQPYNQNLYTVTVVANPFLPVDWAKPFFPRALPLGDQALNPNLFTNPFPVQNLFVPPTSIVGRPSPDAPYNQNLFTVTVSATPFNQTFWPPASAVPLAPFDHHNLVLFVPAVLPLNQYDFSKPFGVVGHPSPDAPYNQNLYQVVVTPQPFLNQFVPTFVPTPGKPVPDSLNPNLFTNPFPFNQYDYLKPVRTPSAPIDLSFTQGQLLTNPVPFNQTDFSKPFRTPQAPIVIDQALNINLYTNPYPVINLAVAYARSPSFPLLDPIYNVNLYGVVTVTNPVVATDVFTPFPVRPSTPPAPGLNPNLFTNPLPNNQYAYPRTVRSPQAPFDLSFAFNPNLPPPVVTTTLIQRTLTGVGL